ncbi:hypothetical protein BDR03DRAFT_974570 [Suillus americanus]|nr:hypothetical protein BDR03DRAFT_974570 [Suillus americanus]
MAAIESFSMSPSAGASAREWSLARTKACCRYVVSRMQVSVSGVARWSPVMCFAIIGLMAAVTSFPFLPASLTGNYPLGTLDYTTSPDHYKLI